MEDVPQSGLTLETMGRETPALHTAPFHNQKIPKEHTLSKDSQAPQVTRRLMNFEIKLHSNQRVHSIHMRSLLYKEAMNSVT